MSHEIKYYKESMKQRQYKTNVDTESGQTYSDALERVLAVKTICSDETLRRPVRPVGEPVRPVGEPVRPVTNLA